MASISKPSRSEIIDGMATGGEERREPGMGKQAVAGAVAAVIGLRLSGPLGAVAGGAATPYLAALIDNVTEE